MEAIIVTPDIIARVTLRPTEAGGRTTATPPVQFRCSLSINDELFDCRLLLNQVGIGLLPGSTVDIPIKFLYIDLVRDMLILGVNFTLWDICDFADGTILEVVLLDKGRF